MTQKGGVPPIIYIAPAILRAARKTPVKPGFSGFCGFSRTFVRSTRGTRVCWGKAHPLLTYFDPFFI
jgi:hypothetical protein